MENTSGEPLVFCCLDKEILQPKRAITISMCPLVRFYNRALQNDELVASLFRVGRRCVCVCVLGKGAVGEEKEGRQAMITNGWYTSISRPLPDKYNSIPLRNITNGLERRHFPGTVGTSKKLLHHTFYQFIF